MVYSSFQSDLINPKNWAWLLAWGIVLMILGIIAISLATLTTLISVILIGTLIFAAGIVVLIDTFKSWWGKWSGFLLHLIMGLLYLAVGFMLIQSPILGSVSLTLLLGVFYLVLGVIRISYSASARFSQWKLSLFNGIISLLLGILILANWPASSLFIIGLFVGIDLFFLGWIYMMIALSAKSITYQNKI